MIRVLLILCHLIAGLPGLRPCCCAFTQPTQSQPAAESKPPAPRKGCPRCHIAPKPDPAPKPNKPAPADKRDCPCPKAELKAPAVPPATDEARQQVVTCDTVAVPVLSNWPACPGLPNTAAGPPPDPSPHLLKLCHRLRC